MLAIEERGLVRQGFENRFIREITQAGGSAVGTFDLLSLPDIKEDKRVPPKSFVRPRHGAVDRAIGGQRRLVP